MNPVKTLCFTFSLVALLAASVVAQTRTIYFFPPDDAKWIAGRSYISDGSTSSALTIDPDRCGWYKTTIPSGSDLGRRAQFWLGKSGMDKIGPNGRLKLDFDAGVNFAAEGGVFVLNDLFNELGNNLYFVADEMDNGVKGSGWTGSDPNKADPTRCKFELAAFIYDTDPAVHPDFSCGTWRQGASEGNGKDTKGACEEGPAAYSGSGGNLKPNCTGVVKGLVKQNLNSTTRKIECDNCKKNGCWTDADWFNKAFTSTKGVNVERCYNMPFTQITKGAGVGSFEFDSDKMQNANGRLVGGFFPELLDKAANDANCPSCNTKRTADRFPPRVSAITKETFDAYQSKEGDFADGDTPTRSAFGATPATESIYDWGARPGDDGKTGSTWTDWYLHGTSAMKTVYKSPQAEYDKNAKANQHFCFESHADFFYDPDQVFYFSGDDPIWVYINNKLVIDLGGAHMAAPGHVELKTLGLTERDEPYPIDIFFCDQRTVNSNARITTNMYVVQKSNFWANTSGARDQPMCAEVSGGSDCASKMGMGNTSGTGPVCGQALIDAKYNVEFFMVPRGTKDTIWLSPGKNSKNCTGSATNFTCYRGIKAQNAVYSCGDKKWCRNDDKAAEKVDLVGNYNVYARLLNSSGTVIGKSIPIDNIRSASNTRIVWGSVTPWPSENNPHPQEKELKDAYGSKTAKEQNIIAGRRTPIYISSGSWNDVGTYTSFSYDDDPANTAGFSVTISGNTGLKIYESETAADNTGVTSYTGNLVNGMATLWVAGGYDIGNKTFKLNVATEGDDAPSLTINLYQPELRFVESDGNTQIRNPDGWSRWKTSGGNPPKDQPPFAGQSLDVYLVAWDAKRNEVCSTCGFTVRTTSSTNNPSQYGKYGEKIVTSNATQITAGKAKVFLSGADEILGENKAKWEVWGASKEQTHAEWTGLQFRKSPVPVPVRSEIFDRNGDGIGDSLYVEFNSSFRKDTSATSGDLNDSALIVLLEVAWAKGEEPIRFHAPEYSIEQLKNKAEVLRLYKTREFFERNRNYWNDKIKGKNLVVVTAPAFSKEVQTIGHEGSLVYSYTPFYERDLCPSPTSCPDGAFQYDETGSKKEIGDRISPVVVKAEYTYVSNNAGNCLDSELGCKEQFIVYLSEPVFAATGENTAGNSPEARKNPFKYCFGRSQGTNCPVVEITPEQRLSQDYDNSDWGWEDPQARDYSSLAIYKPNNTKTPGDMTDYSDGVSVDKGDTIVDMVYYSKKLSADLTTRTPKSDDWVKLRTDYKIYQDAAGNFANPRERGVLVTGVNPARKKQVKIAQVVADPKAPVIGGTFDGSRNDDYYYPNWISNDTRDWARDNLYKTGNVAEFLPVPKHITNPDTIKAYYPGSVGTLFDISDRLGQDLKKFVQDKCTATATEPNKKCKIGGKDLSEYNIDELAPGAISIHASAFYHTNLGDYTAHRNSVQLDCTSELFRNDANVGNCISNNYNFYLAWDLKTNAGRFVGAGAYVAIAKFYWQIKYDDENGNPKTARFGKDEAIEMFGVRRVPK